MGHALVAIGGDGGVVKKMDVKGKHRHPDTSYVAVFGKSWIPTELPQTTSHLLRQYQSLTTLMNEKWLEWDLNPWSWVPLKLERTHQHTNSTKSNPLLSIIII